MCNKPRDTICFCPVSLDKPMTTKKMFNAIYHIDIIMKQMRIVPKNNYTIAPIWIRFENILVIGPAGDFVLFFDPNKKLSKEDLLRATVLQYISAEGHRRRLCFLLETQNEQRQFVSMFTFLCCSHCV